MPVDLPNDLPQTAFGFMLVLVRVGAAMAVLPGLGEAAAPAMVRGGLALAVALLLYPALAPVLPQAPLVSLTAAGMIAAEAITGLWCGWLARLLTLALPAAAQFIAYMLGLTSVLQSDAELGPQTTALARLFEMAAPVLILALDLYRLPLLALAGLYRLIPAGAWLPAADTAQVAVAAMTEMFGLALRLASPFVLAAIVWNAGVGMAARLVPRMQVYFVAMPGQILGGLVLLAALSGTLLTAWQGTVRTGFLALPGAG
jgi:flagellar biosynthetic protein FliR